jgi:hypothetical protein
VLTARKNWSASEIEYVKQHVGIFKIQTIADKLGRSEQSVLNKMKKLGLSNTKNQTGYLTTNELSDILKVDRTVIRGWMKRHGLTYIKRATRTTKKFYLIHPKDFWEWAEKHQEKIDFSKIEANSIVPEPAWVNKQRKIKKKPSYKVWSTKEEKLLLQMRLEDMSVKRAAQILGRSEVSIQRKYDRLIKEI